MKRLFAVLGATLLVACSEAGGPDIPASFAGTYAAGQSFGVLRFTAAVDGVTRDMVDEGASLELVLNADGTTGGRLFIPGGDEDGSDLDAGMAGTWEVSGGNIVISQDADTFVRDMEFAREGDRLIAERDFGTVRIYVELQRR